MQIEYTVSNILCIKAVLITADNILLNFNQTENWWGKLPLLILPRPFIKLYRFSNCVNLALGMKTTLPLNKNFIWHFNDTECTIFSAFLGPSNEWLFYAQKASKTWRNRRALTCLRHTFSSRRNFALVTESFMSQA